MWTGHEYFGFCLPVFVFSSNEHSETKEILFAGQKDDL